jgi:hypothetical protein
MAEAILLLPYPLKTGTLSLNDVAQRFNLTRDELLNRLL